LFERVTLTIRKIEQGILAAGGHVLILTTKSGSNANTHLNGKHQNRQVVFLDNSLPIPFVMHEDDVYELGFSISDSVKSQLEDFEPSLIHISVPDCAALALVQYARDCEIPLMGTHHSNLPEYMNHYPGARWVGHLIAHFLRHNFNFLQVLYATTPYMRQYLIDTHKLDRVTELRVWGRGIDLDRFSPKKRSDKFREKLGIDPDDVVICFVGRLVAEKRPDIVANIIKRFHAENVPFHALIVGAGPAENEMKKLPNTTCAGWLDGDDLATAYASSDIYLFPSSVETFGNATLEAAASGLPLVVDLGCSGHLVKDGVNGYGCGSDDLDAYYQATLTLLTDDEKRAEFSLQSRQMSQQYENRKVMSQMVANYSHVYDEFYSKYGGHHRNRDKQYANKDSFLAGTYPKPIALALIEFFSYEIGKLLTVSFNGIPKVPRYNPTSDISVVAKYGRYEQP